MERYRSLETIEAVQFTGDLIPGVTCDSASPDREIAEKAWMDHGCDSSRKHHIHVHTKAIGGMTVLKPGDWIYPVHGGPWAVATDEKFRAHWEVPKPAAAEAKATAPTVGGDAPIVGGDAGTVGGDSGTVGGDSGTVGGDSGAVGGDTGTVGGDTESNKGKGKKGKEPTVGGDTPPAPEAK